MWNFPFDKYWICDPTGKTSPHNLAEGWVVFHFPVPVHFHSPSVWGLPHFGYCSSRGHKRWFILRSNDNGPSCGLGCVAHRERGRESRNCSDHPHPLLCRRGEKMFRAVQLRVAQAGDLSGCFIQLYLSTASPWDREEEEETLELQAHTFWGCA